MGSFAYLSSSEVRPVSILKRSGFIILFVLVTTLLVGTTSAQYVGSFIYVENGSETLHLFDATTDEDTMLFGKYGASVLDPAWSPDGIRISFGLGEGPAPHCSTFVLDLGTRHVEQITDNEDECDIRHVWSPDGKQIAFIRSKPFGNVAHVVSVNLETGEEKHHFSFKMDPEGSDLSQMRLIWFSDMPEITNRNWDSVIFGAPHHLMISYDETEREYVLDVSNGEHQWATRLTHPMFMPSWNPSVGIITVEAHLDFPEDEINMPVIMVMSDDGKEMTLIQGHDLEWRPLPN
jgi:dipeptidyl aminopeptidase/acylaminoacyl peptidase